MMPSMFRVVDALVKHGGLTSKEITRIAFVSMRTLRGAHISRLSKNGMIYISGWRMDCMRFVPVYSAGVGDTPPRPKVMA